MSAPESVVRVTNVPAIHNAPLPAEGNGSFSNYHLAALVLGVPWVVKRLLPLLNRGGFCTYWFLVLLLSLPITIAYWALMSHYGPRKNEKVKLPGRPAGFYYDIKDPDLKHQWGFTDAKIPMQIFHDAYIEGKIDIKGDVLEALEYRWDWASFGFTVELFKYVFMNLIPDVIFHTRGQDESQVRDHYDRGNDFYSWFLGPRMIYTSGIVKDITREETLEELQDNKLTLVCEKLDLKSGDRLLDIGCGWGTLTAFAAKNYDIDATGVTIAKEQTAFGNERIKNNGLDDSQARVLCMDYRDIPRGKKFNKIVSLEMAEHVGIRRYNTFLREVYDLLDDDGIFVLQVAGLRPTWQYHDLVWGLFMNKYIFPGADASCALNWVIGRLEGVGFEVKSIDVLGVHYSATIWRWYKNWLSNEEKVVEKYGRRWFRLWTFFLAWSVIVAREGGSSVFQITLHKNLNAYHRIEGVPSHTSLHGVPPREVAPIV
ncbi:sphingolipid C9-methyltransferase [Cantharellus anzutake]|uniref:sphingolipid C9-methyltransferase n=1 Tax=Cantharellus anzutake TaxID=1750568 RepID=UPI001907A46B|nr:sphingolipid C9-methyltransferase [Cantharellus anzutake]KAF8326840.1 sphingolipid C9-methyltransferase [Cantharellus anzutake]